MKINFKACTKEIFYNSRTVVPRYVNACAHYCLNLTDTASEFPMYDRTLKAYSNQVYMLNICIFVISQIQEKCVFCRLKCHFQVLMLCSSFMSLYKPKKKSKLFEKLASLAPLLLVLLITCYPFFYYFCGH